MKNIINRSDMISCALCMDAPCSSACRAIDPAKAFDTYALKGASQDEIKSVEQGKK